MPFVSSSGYAHVRLTVTDIKRSKAFYDQVFGWTVAMDESAHVDEPGVRNSPERIFGGVIYLTPSGTLLGLRPVSTDRFDPNRTGLDHLSFLVESRRELEEAQKALEAAGIEHGEVKDLAAGGIAILSFSDPDGVQLELTAPLG
jgi:catechol 2,3-dioxygenase-like lactoylglutathione lyase family enzyme